ncbi:MAG: two pore domain potassium channel family protein [Synechococcus sp. s2_metabat2_7]|nr:two pore domain potassium channel family protein [Synechococcus sp. s2_metabat2_7]
MKSDRSKRRHRDKIYELLLSLCLMVLVSFAFPRLSWIGLLGYALIALLLTQLVMIRKETLTLGDRLYQLLGLGALSALLLWQITPVRWVVSGVPLVLTWSVLVGWSVIRLVERLSQERKVTAGLLMGAAAGYLLLGLTAGLVMSAVETIQPGSFAPLNSLQEPVIGANASVLMKMSDFSQINYFAFVCLTTVGFGDIQPVMPVSRMLSVVTGIIGPLYLAVVMGVLIGRYTRQVEEEEILEHDERS